MSSMETVDIVILLLYFALILAVGIWASVKAERGSARGFFLAGKSMSAYPLAGSMFATNMGATMFIGLAGTSAASGFAPIMFEWHAVYMLILLGWIFVPIYVASGTFTMPQYLKKRYGRQRMRVYYACVQLILAILSGISAEIFAGAIFIEVLLGWNIYAATVAILAITAIYTIGGGLAAVIYTDALQTIILVTGAVILSVLVTIEIGGYEAMWNQFIPAASNNTYLYESLYGNLSCGVAPSDSFHIFRSRDSDYPWTGLVFGLTILALYYWCNSQVMVQRNLSAKNMIHSKGACIMAGYLKILPFFLFTWPGMMSRILYPDEIACSDPDTCESICSDPSGCTNAAYPYLVLRELPTGLRGLMLAAMLAALMSSLTSQYNSCSSVFVIDIWKVARKNASEKEVVVVGRLAGLTLIVLSVLYLPILSVMQGGNLWDYIQSISAYVSPPWVVVFLCGILWNRSTEKACWWGLMAGLVVGMVRMALHFANTAPLCGSGDEDTRPYVLAEVHYLNFAMFLAVFTFVVILCLTPITKPRRPNQLHRVTWWTRNDEEWPDWTDSEDELKEQEEELAAEEKNAEKDELNGEVGESGQDLAYLGEDEIKESTGRKVYNFICGFNTTKQEKLTREEIDAMRRKITDIGEDPFWEYFMNVNAVVVVAVTCFIIGFYA